MNEFRWTFRTSTGRAQRHLLEGESGCEIIAETEMENTMTWLDVNTIIKL